MRRALTIAGTDSGGGAGVLADVRTFAAHGVWATSAVTAVTAQNTLGVQRFETVSPDLVRQQIESVADDIGIDAAKTGMLATAEIVQVVCELAALGRLPNLVVDPVFVSKHGDTLLADDAVGALRDSLLPHATVVTPNLPEAAVLLHVDTIRTRDEMEDAARVLLELGPQVVLLKGGHLPDEGASPDLVAEGDRLTWLEGARISGRHTHGTGCVLSAALAAELARGMAPADACLAAKRFVEHAIAAGREIGAGVGPVDPGWEFGQVSN